jgi:hypothetical protein
LSGTKSKLRKPSESTLGNAQRFVFDTLRWDLLFRSSPAQFFVHGDAEFERLRAGEGIETSVDLARSAVVRAIVRLVERANPRSVSFSFGGLEKIEDRRAEVLKHLRKRIREQITATRKAGGFDAVERVNSLPTKADLLPVEVPVASPLRTRDPTPEELVKAIKYLIGGPAGLSLIQLSKDPFKLGVKLKPVASGYLRGDRIGSATDRARTAAAMTVQTIVSNLSGTDFRALARLQSGPEPSAIRAALALRSELLSIATNGGHAALVGVHGRARLGRGLAVTLGRPLSGVKDPSG